MPAAAGVTAGAVPAIADEPALRPGDADGRDYLRALPHWAKPAALPWGAVVSRPGLARVLEEFTDRCHHRYGPNAFHPARQHAVWACAHAFF